MSGESADEKSYNLSVLTLNVWGLPGILTPNKSERLKAIAEELNKGKFDVVCLQELWLESDFKLLVKLTSSVYVFSHYFHSGVIGSGLAILSKWKIVMTFYHQWPLNGYMHMIQHADWFGGKGVGLAQIQFHDLKINIYNTHLHAQYNTENDRYIAHRVVQSLDTGLFVHITSLGAQVVLFCGDFNSEPGDICYNLISMLGDLQDSHKADINTFTNWGTCGSMRNSFTNKELANKAPTGKRLDHIFYKSQGEYLASAQMYYFPFETTIPGKNFSYSDHEAVASEFLIRKWKKDTTDAPCKDPTECVSNLQEALKICYQARRDVTVNTRFYIFWSLLILSIVFLHPLAIQFSTFVYCTVLLSLTLVLYFFLFMATIWHRLETRAICGAIKRLQTLLKSFE